MSKYTASLIGGQNILFRPYIEIYNDSIRFKIPGFLSGDEQTMQLESITDVRISGTIVTKTIEIYSSGMGVIKAEGFSPSDARSVKQEIDSNRNKAKNQQSNSNSSSFAHDEDNDEDDEVYDSTMSERRLNEARFTNAEKIPLLTFSSNHRTLLNTLNSLVHYANVNVNDRSFTSLENIQNKVTLYILKVNEGIRFANSLKGDSYFKSETSRLQNEIDLIQGKAERKTKGSRRSTNIGLTVAIIFSLLMFFLAFKGCKYFINHARF